MTEEEYREKLDLALYSGEITEKEHEDKYYSYGDPIPRNDRGWPSISPEHFTDEQLRKEAAHWASVRGTNYVGGVEFDKYNSELLRRGIEVDWSYIAVDIY